MLYFFLYSLSFRKVLLFLIVVIVFNHEWVLDFL